MTMELEDTYTPGQVEIVPAEPSRGIMERPFTGAEIKAQVNMIQEVMREVMVDGIHYGQIPGTGGKKTMLKPGAEKLNLTFRISPKIIVEDLSTADEMRYRVLCKGYHILSGDFLGDGIGEASSNEEKYKWRRSVVNAEFEETPEDRRREVYKKNQQGKYVKVKQVRTNPADIANTVLKMGKKRANIDMILTVTAASDVFAQDYEDMTPEMREALGQDEEGIKEPERKSEAKPPAKKKAEPKKKAAPPKAKSAGDPRGKSGGNSEPPGEPPPWKSDPDDPGPREDDAPPASEEDEGPEAPIDGDCFTAIIESVVSKKTGTSPKGDWEMFLITLSTGDSLSCFDKTLVADATTACNEGVLCNVYYEEDQYGNKLTGLEVIG